MRLAVGSTSWAKGLVQHGQSTVTSDEWNQVARLSYIPKRASQFC